MTFAPNPVTTEQLVQYLSDHVGNEVGCKNVKEAASKLFSDLGPRFKETNGGYIRLIKSAILR